MAERPGVVLTISRQLASGGSQLGRAVAGHLGFRYVDREILDQAARMLGCKDESEIEPLEECHRGVWARVSHTMSLGPPDGHFGALSPGVHEEEVFEVEGRIIREISCVATW